MCLNLNLNRHKSGSSSLIGGVSLNCIIRVPERETAQHMYVLRVLAPRVRVGRVGAVPKVTSRLAATAARRTVAIARLAGWARELAPAPVVVEVAVRRRALRICHFTMFGVAAHPHQAGVRRRARALGVRGVVRAVERRVEGRVEVDHGVAGAVDVTSGNRAGMESFGGRHRCQNDKRNGTLHDACL